MQTIIAAAVAASIVILVHVWRAIRRARTTRGEAPVAQPTGPVADDTFMPEDESVFDRIPVPAAARGVPWRDELEGFARRFRATAARDPGVVLMGERMPRYKLHPPVDVASSRIALPEDFGWFVSAFARGFEGPGFGMEPFELDAIETFSSPDEFVENAKPDEGGPSLVAFLERFARAHEPVAVVPLSHGDAAAILVVCADRRGFVFFDERARDVGFVPAVASSSEPGLVDFTKWVAHFVPGEG